MADHIGHNGGPSLAHDEPKERPGNWFAVSRDIFDHPIIGIHQRAFTDTEAWLYLLSIAAYAPTEVENKGGMIVLDPGQIMAAHAFLAKRWTWSTDKVRWYLKRLETEAMITRFTTSKSTEINTKQHTNQDTCHHTNPNTSRNTNQIQVITICKYAFYQYVQTQLHQLEHQPLHQASHQPEHQPSHQQLNTKNTKNSILDSESDVYAHVAKANVAPTTEPVIACQEYPVDHGVLVNGKTIRHNTGSFLISLPAVHQAARKSGWTDEDMNAKCLARALQWGAQIESGMMPDLVLPPDIAGTLSAEIVQEADGAKATAKAERSARKGTRLPTDWRLPKSWGEYSLQRFQVAPDQIRREADKFRDYWLSATRNATKKDWFAAWRVWCSSDRLKWRERPGYRPSTETLPMDAPVLHDAALAALDEDREIARRMMEGDDASP